MAALKSIAAVAVAALAASNAAIAAGGHHGVDDASLIEPGQCEVEGWFTRARSARLLHGGLGCRVGAVELGASAEHERDGEAGRTGQALQAKWAREWVPGLSAGASVTGGWAAHERPRYQGTSAALLVSWALKDNLTLHANLGRDFVRAAPDRPRSGVSFEWSPVSRRQLSLTAERYLEDESHFARAGVRWFASERLTVDFSRAQRLAGPGASNWTVGTTLAFGR